MGGCGAAIRGAAASPRPPPFGGDVDSRDRRHPGPLRACDPGPDRPWPARRRPGSGRPTLVTLGADREPEIEALRVDRYLESILVARERGAIVALHDPQLDADLRATAERL